MYRTVIPQTKILRCKSVYIDGNIGKQLCGQQYTLLQHGTVEKRFQYTTCTSGRLNNIYLATINIGSESHVTIIGKYVVRLQVDNQCGKVENTVLREFGIPTIQYL